MSIVRNSKFSLCVVFSVGAAIFMLAAYAAADHHGEPPAVSLGKPIYSTGENIVVNFSNGPGNKDDWIAVYAKDVVPGSGIFTELWYFANGKREASEIGVSNGSLVLDSASDNPDDPEVDWPLADGDYDVYFLCCDGYDVLAGPVNFKIESADGG